MEILRSSNENIESLIHAYLSGVISPKEKDELFSWIVQNPENVKYFNQLSDIWLSSSVFQDSQDFNEVEAFSRVKEKINFVNMTLSSGKKQKNLSWLKVAAILIPAIILGGILSRLFLPSKPDFSEHPFVFEVPYGAKATIVLPDNSKVVLNAGSKLTCNEGFGKTNRLLKLTGEGYFTVAKNKNLPFIVHAGNLDVKALGTEFNVKAYPEDINIEAVLIHGSIQVNKNLNSGTEKREKPLVLLPKQSLVYSKQTDHFKIKIAVTKSNTASSEINVPAVTSSKVDISTTTIDPTIYTTWKEGSWIIYQQELSEVAVALERKFDVKISFGTESLKKFKVTGSLPDISLEQVLAAIRLTAPIEYKINGKQVELFENKGLIPLYKKYYKSSSPD